MEDVETTETVHEVSFTEDGTREVETTTVTLPEVRHCTCEACLARNEEIISLRERVAALEAERTEEAPAPAATETVVETSPEVEAETKKDEPSPRRSAKRGAGALW